MSDLILNVLLSKVYHSFWMWLWNKWCAYCKIVHHYVNWPPNSLVQAYTLHSRAVFLFFWGGKHVCVCACVCYFYMYLKKLLQGKQINWSSTLCFCLTKCWILKPFVKYTNTVYIIFYITTKNICLYYH